MRHRLPLLCRHWCGGSETLFARPPDDAQGLPRCKRQMIAAAYFGAEACGLRSSSRNSGISVSGRLLVGIGGMTGLLTRSRRERVWSWVCCLYGLGCIFQGRGQKRWSGDGRAGRELSALLVGCLARRSKRRWKKLPHANTAKMEGLSIIAVHIMTCNGLLQMRQSARSLAPMLCIP